MPAQKKNAKKSSAKAEKNAEQPRILVLHGPNLDLLGEREPAVYGAATLDDINLGLARLAEAAGAELFAFQTNHEGAMIERIHAARAEKVRAIIINPAAWTHTSVAIRDALLAIAVPFIEVHLTNIHAREPFRHHSYFSDAAAGVIAGLGHQGYFLALQYILNRIKTQNS
jgi:3-dehydroquinate dehydratase-2